MKTIYFPANLRFFLAQMLMHLSVLTPTTVTYLQQPIGNSASSKYKMVFYLMFTRTSKAGGLNRNNYPHV
jgi:hypothetical protein